MLVDLLWRGLRRGYLSRANWRPAGRPPSGLVIAAIAGVLCAALFMEGCMIGFDTAVLPCSGEACDNTRWVIMTLAGSDDLEHARQQVAIFLPGACGIERVQLPDLSPLNGGDTQVRLAAWSVRPAGSLELAITDTSGNLAIVGLNGPETAQTKSLGAVGVAWSNAGDRLAVVTRDRSQPAEQAHQLLILSPQLEELDRFALDLPVSDRSRDLIHDRFVVSWNGDDTQIAVSTTVACSTGLATDFCDQWRVIPRCNVVRLSDGRTQILPLYDAWFVGTNTLVATPASDAPHIALNMARRVERITLGTDGTDSHQPLIGPVFLYSANPPAGVIVTEDPATFGINSVTRSVSLRSADGRRKDPRVPNVILAVSALNAKDLPPVLVPADAALPALREAGLAPECP